MTTMHLILKISSARSITKDFIGAQYFLLKGFPLILTIKGPHYEQEHEQYYFYSPLPKLPTIRPMA
jgi:hypothetical protein